MLKWIADLLTIAPKAQAPAPEPEPVLLPTREELLRRLADAKTEADRARFDVDFWKSDSAHQVGKQQELKAEIRKLQANVDYQIKQLDAVKAERDDLAKQVEVQKSIADQAKSERDDAAKKRDEAVQSLVGAEDCMRRMHAVTCDYFGVENT